MGKGDANTEKKLTNEQIITKLSNMQFWMRTKDDLYSYLDNLKQLIINDYGSLEKYRSNGVEEAALSDVKKYSHKVDYV